MIKGAAVVLIYYYLAICRWGSYKTDTLWSIWLLRFLIHCCLLNNLICNRLAAAVIFYHCYLLVNVAAVFIIKLLVTTKCPLCNHWFQLSADPYSLLILPCDQYGRCGSYQTEKMPPLPTYTQKIIVIFPDPPEDQNKDTYFLIFFSISKNIYFWNFIFFEL